MRRPLVAGNWKMNGSLQSIQELLATITAGVADGIKADCAVFPPFPYLGEVERLLSGTVVRWGAQNVSQRAPGAFTGEVATAMLLDFHCTYVIVGHSERRALYGESSAIVAEKFAAARKAGIIPILCVGETLEEREGGVMETVIAEQLDAVIELEGIKAFDDAVIAYEPVWAIGTGKTATPEQAQEVHAFIRGRLATHDADVAARERILYGGSVKGSNAAELFAMPDIDGGLVGGAALNGQEFVTIIKAV
ncbi:MAG: triose-phosphate isomerase [Gammaproteobacteria bacterium]|nr:triose-phosphate isomerase [Gammaproteobacteria bacterium]MCP5425026.1 triose-phosphate isomerase [Gammaproteobacteria bacterium]